MHSKVRPIVITNPLYPISFLFHLCLDSVRAFKKRNKIGRFAEDAGTTTGPAAPDFKEDAKMIILNSRCLVEPVEGGMQKRGKVLFVGLTQFKPGYWVGIRYDEPLGKHDGK